MTSCFNEIPNIPLNKWNKDGNQFKDFKILENKNGILNTKRDKIV